MEGVKNRIVLKAMKYLTIDETNTKCYLAAHLKFAVDKGELPTNVYLDAVISAATSASKANVLHNLYQAMHTPNGDAVATKLIEFFEKK